MLNSFGATGLGLGVVLVLFLLRVRLRRQWVATATFTLVFIGLAASSQLGHPAVWTLTLLGVPLTLLMTAGLLWFGALPLAMMFFVGICSLASR